MHTENLVYRDPVRQALGWFRALAVALGLLGAIGSAEAVQVSCSGGGDAFGWAVASGGDFDGDQVNDIAVGGPCARANRQRRAGRVRIFSGADGSLLVSLKGDQDGQNLGGALDFIPDLDGDGKDELAVGSPGFDSQRDAGGEITNAGKLEIYSFPGEVVPGLTVVGVVGSETRGETVIAVEDVTGDNIADIWVGGGGAKVDFTECVNGNLVQNREERGQAQLISGANGALVAVSDGGSKFDRWSGSMAATGDFNGDQVADMVISSGVADVIRQPPDTSCEEPRAARGLGSTTTTTTTTTTSLSTDSSTTTSTTSTTLPEGFCGDGELDEGETCDDGNTANNDDCSDECTITPLRLAGIATVVSGAAPFQELARIQGDGEDQLVGRGVAGIDDVDDDERADVLIGSPGVDVGLTGGAGTVRLISSRGGTAWTATEPLPVVGAGFGTEVTSPGKLDGDDVPDAVASAPLGSVGRLARAGRVHALSGVDGGVLWTVVGAVPGARLGQSLVGTDDSTGDEVPEVVIGVPGDAPRGRRGAGSATIVSGVDGSKIASFRGRRGTETRLFVAGVRNGRSLEVRSFDPFGRKRELRSSVFRGQRSGTLSLAVLDDVLDPDPGGVRVVVGTGPGSGSREVQVLRAGRRRSMVARFDAFTPAYEGGVNVGSGEFFRLFQGDNENDEVAVVQADSDTDDVELQIWRKEFVNSNGAIGFIAISQFPVFSNGDTIERAGVPEPIQLEIKADGANLAVGNLVGSSSVGSVIDEIVVGPVEGAPVVRVFDSTGDKLAEWLAYRPEGSGSVTNSGVNVAIGDLDGDGVNEIVTAPGSGQLEIKIWDKDGNPLTVGFFVGFGAAFQAGVRIAVADVDFDDEGEIIIAPGPDPTARNTRGVVKAFEMDGTPVAGWKNFSPFGPASFGGLSLAATDRFLRP